MQKLALPSACRSVDVLINVRCWALQKSQVRQAEQKSFVEATLVYYCWCMPWVRLTFPNNIKADIEQVFLAQALELMFWKLTQALLTIEYVQLVNSHEVDLQSNYMYK